MIFGSLARTDHSEQSNASITISQSPKLSLDDDLLPEIFCRSYALTVYSDPKSFVENQPLLKSSTQWIVNW